jgi:hypothetical protein
MFVAVPDTIDDMKRLLGMSNSLTGHSYEFGPGIPKTPTQKLTRIPI